MSVFAVEGEDIDPKVVNKNVNTSIDSTNNSLFHASPVRPPVNVNKRLYNKDRLYRLAGRAYGSYALPVVNVNKVAAYKTELAKKRYVFPQPGEEAQEKDI